MSKEELALMWDDLKDLREECRGLRSRLDRLYWASVVAAVAIGGPQIVDRFLSLVM